MDGADAIDSSVNGVRATVSQEGVQEFQVISSSYMPEYGRAMGGVVNIVTKSGSNDYHGNAFGFLRNGAIQAQNPFSVTAFCDPATDQCGTTPVKQSYTRVQAGLTLGGPIQKDKTFFFSVTNSRAAKKPDSPRSARTISGSSIRTFCRRFRRRARCLRIW